MVESKVPQLNFRLLLEFCLCEQENLLDGLKFITVTGNLDILNTACHSLATENSGAC